MGVWTTCLVAALVCAAPGTGWPEPANDTPTPAAVPSPARADATSELAIITPDRAGDHVDEEVVVEGRVYAVYVSQLATVLAFAPNYAGFTATIHVADRARFPNDIHETVRDRAVRLRGRITAYRGRVEMRLSNPSQLVILEATAAPEHTPPAVSATYAEELRAMLARIETRLDNLERRLTTIEQAPPTGRAGARSDQLTVGMPASAAEAVLGSPLEELDDATGLRVWVYEHGRTVTFDASARVVTWTGFGE